MKISGLFPWIKKAPAPAPQPFPVSDVVPLQSDPPVEDTTMKILIALCEMTGDDTRTVTVTDSKGKDHTLDLAHSQAHIEVGTQGAAISVDGGRRKAKAD